MSNAPILVTGATGYTGRHLVKALHGAGHRLRLLTRSTSDTGGLPQSAERVEADLEQPETLGDALRGVRTVYHLAHIRFGEAVVRSLDPNVERLVAVSSQRAVSKVPSTSVDEVRAGEAAVTQSPAPWTILRPSMIFGPGDDRNISRLAARLQRSAWIPVVGQPNHHQPVLVHDVVGAIRAAAGSDAAIGKTYAIAGPQPLTYGALVAAVGVAVGVRPRQVPVPTGVVAALLGMLEGCGLERAITSEQVRRMAESKSCDITAAEIDLGFRPQPFDTALARIYGTPA